MHTPNPSVCFFRTPEATEGQLHPLNLEEYKEDASTTFAQDPLHSNRDSERKSLALDPEKQIFMSQSTQSPPAGWLEESANRRVVADSRRGHPEIEAGLEAMDTDEGQRGETRKDCQVHSTQSEIADPPKFDHITLANRPRTAEISGSRLEELAKEEEKSEIFTPVRPFEEEKYPILTFPSVPDILLPSDPHRSESSSAVDGVHSSPMVPLLSDHSGDSGSQQEGSSDQTPPPQPPPTSPLMEEEKVELFHSEQVNVPRRVALVFSSPVVLIDPDQLSEDESHPRPTDSVAHGDDQPFSPNDVQFIDVESEPRASQPPVEEGKASLEPFHRQPSSDDSPVVPRLSLERRFTPSSEHLRIKMTYWHCLTGLKGSSLSPFMPTLKEKRPARCWDALFRCCGSTVALSQAKQHDCDVIAALAKRPIGSLDIDLNLMYSVWCFHFPTENFTAESVIWTDIGFKNANPRTEVVTLEMLQILFLAMEQPTTAQALLAFSRKRGATFSFALEIAAVTQLAVKVVKSRRLDTLLQDSPSVFDSFNTFFLGCLRKWFSAFQRSPNRVDWIQLEELVRKRPREVLASAKCTLGA